MSLYSPFTAALEKVRLLFQRRNGDALPAVLGDKDGPGARVDIPDKIGYVYARFPGTPDANGFATYSAPFPVRSGNAAYANYPGAPVYIAYGYSGDPEIVSANNRAFDQAGIDTRLFNPANQQSKWVYLWQLTIGLCSAVANSVTGSFLVTVKKYRHYVNNIFQTFETAAQADKVDLQPYIPATDMHCYAAVWVDTYANTAHVTTSTAQSMFTTLDDTDIQECVTERPPDAIPHKLFYLSNDQGSITQQAAKDVDVRQFLNTPSILGLPNPVAYQERVHPDRALVYHGTLTVTATLTVLGSVAVLGDSGGGSGGSNVSGWQDDGTVVRLVTTTDNVNIGGTTDLGKLAVVGDADEIQLRVRANATQTADLIRIDDTAGNKAIEIRGNGATRFNVQQNAFAFVSIEGTDGTYILYADVSNSGLGLGTALVDASAKMEVFSTTKGILIPRMTTTQRNAIGTPATALLIFNTTTGQFEFYTGAVWTNMGGANTALSNLASVAINTTLVSDTDNTDDLGTTSVKWREAFTNLLTLEERSAPSTPASGDFSTYAKVSGGGQLFMVNDGGIHKQVSESIAILWDAKAANTAGGTSSSTTWNNRDLNTEHYDPDAIVSISSNQFTPIAGDYELWCYSAATGGSAAGSATRNRLFNVTGGAAVQQGATVFAGTNAGIVAPLSCKFTANGSDAYRIDTYTQTGRATNGLGIQANDGSSEIYTVVVLRKIA